MSEEEEVFLYVYDLSGGMASRLSPALIGKQVEGIWHTGVVAFGKEYYFGSSGIQMAIPGSVIGQPLKKLSLGKTYVPVQVFEEYLNGLAESEFRGPAYDLLKHNCNNFSDAISNFLVGTGIPTYILGLPEEILNSQFGQTFRGLIEQISGSSPNLESYPSRRERSPEYYQIHSEIEAARRSSILLKEKRNKIYEKLAKREKKKNKKRRETERNPAGGEAKSERMSEEVAQVDGEMGEDPRSLIADASQKLAAEIEEEERREREERRKNREPPIVFKDAVDVHIEFDSLVGLIDGKLNEEEQQSLEELHKYMLEDEGSWALGEQFLVFVGSTRLLDMAAQDYQNQPSTSRGRLLTDQSLGEEAGVRILQVLAAGALKDDVILMLHQDRKHHILMNYAYDVDRHPIAQQKSLTLFICNLFENIGSAEWLMYISEWTYNNNQLSNIRVTTKVAVNALLSDDVDMQDRGSAIIYNIATKEVFDDIAVELTMAVLQYLSGETRSEAHIFRSLRSLNQFCQAGQDVPQLVQMIGPHPSKFKGQSERIDQIIQEVTKKIR